VNQSGAPDEWEMELQRRYRAPLGLAEPDDLTPRCRGCLRAEHLPHALGCRVATRAIVVAQDASDAPASRSKPG